MTMIYLYIKTHNKTGLKYLGITRQDPYKYKGSGLYWRRHIKSNGNDVTTEILKECDNLSDIKKWGEYYSTLFDIVESTNWANLKPETGEGAPSGKYHHYKKEDYDKRTHPNYGKKHNISTIEKNRVANTGENNPSFGTMWINNGIENKKIDSTAEIPSDWVIGRIIYYSEKFGKRNKNGENYPMYQRELMCFIHVSGEIENLTPNEMIKKHNLRASSISSLIHGNLKSTAGWRLLNEK